MSTNIQVTSDKHSLSVTNLDEDLNQNSIDHDQNDKDRIVPSRDTYDTPGGKGTIDKDAEKGKNTYTENIPVKNNLAKVTESEYFRKGRYQEKIIFTISVTTLISLALSLMNIHWFLPYYYAISTPVLLAIRVVMYWKSKWQYFLFDFCYFTNVFCYVYIWVVPASSETSVVLFALANGPLAWASVLFRNALALHDMDRMTSCYIHMLPMVMSFGLRWYPDEMSFHWYKRFYGLYPEDVDYMFIWVFAIPLACFMFHWALYLLVVFAICKPDESYLNSLRYLASRRNSCPGRTLYAFGENHLLLTYTAFNLLYSTLSLLLTVLVYKYFAAHVVYISVIALIVTWNGSTFYIDVFAAKRCDSNS